MVLAATAAEGQDWHIAGASTITFMWRDIFRSIKTPEERMAWLVAIGALQLAVTPLFAEGALSPADAVLDASVASERSTSPAGRPPAARSRADESECRARARTGPRLPGPGLRAAIPTSTLA